MTTQASPITLLSLGKQKHVNLTTFRRTGAAVGTPVWFVRLEDTVYIYSDATAGKVNRIRNNPQVQVAVCTMLGKVIGPTVTGVARIVTDPEEQARAKAALDAKYRIARRLLGLLYGTMHLLQRSKPADPIVYLAVMPALPR
ncbi:MAG: PPOX class F420-dependent oxidoreductase [Chloroflexi bacterium]|nr:MAG: PPOX class F420-dependent oxidoreductase [Chloroflexota bacterium]